VRVEQHRDAAGLECQHDVADVRGARSGRVRWSARRGSRGPDGRPGRRQPRSLLHAPGEAAQAVAPRVAETHECQTVALLLPAHVDPRQPHVQDRALPPR
jgi:hypothetical protein